MQIVTTHTRTDFDALASVVACTFLYPGSVGVLPRMLNPEVKQFLAIHQNILRVTTRKGFDLEEVTSLIVVDANNWNRLDSMTELASREDLEVICWDHHMEGVSIDSHETYREEVGAAVTLLLEKMQERDTAISPMHATLFLLGIYSDTGCLRYPSVTNRDAAMVSYLIENGADLNVVSAYLDDSMDDAHTELFGRMLDESEIVIVGTVSVGICALSIHSGLTSLSTLVDKYREFRGVDAAFGVFQSDTQKSMVIGRGKPQFIDVGKIMRSLGGGGHPGAGSAIIKNVTPEEGAQQVKALVERSCNDATEVCAIMSNSARFIVESSVSMAEAALQMEAQNVSGLLICEGPTLVGGLSVQDCAIAEKKGRFNVPVKGCARRNIPQLAPTTCCREAILSMVDAREGILAVVEGGALVGVVTQTDLLMQVYDF